MTAATMTTAATCYLQAPEVYALPIADDGDEFIGVDANGRFIIHDTGDPDDRIGRLITQLEAVIQVMVTEQVLTRRELRRMKVIAVVMAATTIVLSVLLITVV